MKFISKILFHGLIIGFFLILFELIFNDKFVLWLKEHVGGDPAVGYFFYWLTLISLLPYYLLELSTIHKSFSFLKKVAFFVAIPNVILQLFKPIIDIIFVNFFSFLLILFLAYLPILFIIRENPQLSYPGKLYLFITGITIWTHLLLPWLNTIGLKVTATDEEYGNKKLSQKKEALLKHSINKDRVTVVFYICFFLILIVYNLVTIVFEVNYDPNYDIGKALIACAATYTAFEKIVLNITKFKFSIRKFFQLYFIFIEQKHNIRIGKKKYPKFP